MSKIITSFLVLGLSLIFINNTKAQAFQKGSKNLDLGVGFGIYGTTQKATTTFNGVSTSTKDNDGAVSTIIPLTFEYGISDKVGIGAEFGYSNYFINDSDRVNLNKVSCIDFGLNVNYHLLNAEKNDLFLGLGIGVSSMKIDYTTSQFQFIDAVNGSGMFFSLGLTDRIFFSDHIGILFNLSYRSYNYNSLEADFSPEIDQLIASSGFTYSQTWDWKFSGVHIGTGIAFKF